MRNVLRKNNRLAGWDYSSAAIYFVTTCTFDRKPLLGKIVYNEDDLVRPAYLQPSALGAVCLDELGRLAADASNCALLASAVMPNHVHLLLELRKSAEADRVAPNLSTIVSQFKRRVTYHARRESNDSSLKVWQRSYHDHIVRSDEDLERICEYIENNPVRWVLDKYYVD